MPTQGNIDTSYPTLLETENKIRLLEPFTGAKAHHSMQCLICDHIWRATPLSKRQTLKKNGVTGCPSCNDKRKLIATQQTQQVHLDAFAQLGLRILSDFTALRSTTTKLKFQNINCGHIFESYPGNVIEKNTTCTVCGIQNRTATVTAWSKSNSLKWQETATEWQQYKSTVTALTEQIYRKHKKSINPQNHPRGKAGVDGAYHLDHKVPKRFCFDNAIPPEVCASIDNLQMLGWRENVGSRSHIKGVIPPLFFQYISTNSKLEQHAKTLQQILPNSKAFVSIGDVVATVYDEATNRAVIVIPLDSSHANMKSGLAVHKALTAAQVQFTILFEDELANHRLLTAKLSHYSGTNIVTKIHARSCVIKQCTKEEKRVLLDANHMQGNDNAQVYYGAYHADVLIAVMTFTAPRVALGQKDKTKDRTGVWELSRFCTDVNYRIPGIASKLLTHFQRNNHWVNIYSYADKRWSVGNMYYQLGFALSADNPPDYFYIIDGQRKHRWNYRKDILKTTLLDYDATLTEYQNMVNHGYYRVWDCGTLKFDMYALT